MNKKAKIMYIALFVFFAAVFVISAVVVVDYLIESKRQADEFDAIASIVASVKDNVTDPTEDSVHTAPNFPGNFDILTEPVETEPTILPEYQAIYDQNPHLVGWIQIPGTKVNYPVMQTPNSKDYYLKRDFYGEYSTAGCIYVREQCDVFEPSDNLTIYGHNMKNGSMFHDLRKYKSKSYWEAHQTLTFDTLYEHHTYQIIAVFKTSGTSGKGYPYHRFVDAETEEEFNEFVADILDLAMYDTGLTAEYGDKLICLSTCEYSISNGRLVVVAKRIE